MAKWLKITIALTLTVAILGMSIWFIFFSGVLDKSKKYTYQDLQDMYDAGYSDGGKKSSDLLTVISGLENHIDSLENENAVLESELLEYQKVPDLVNVSFIVDNEMYRSLNVRQGGSIVLDIDAPTKWNYKFLGWTLNDEIIDIKNYVFEYDCELYAKFETFYGSYQLQFDLTYYSKRTFNSMSGMYSYSELKTDTFRLEFVYNEDGIVNLICKDGLNNSIENIRSNTISYSAEDEMYSIIFKPIGCNYNLIITLHYSTDFVMDPFSDFNKILDINDDLYGTNGYYWYCGVSRLDKLSIANVSLNLINV